MAGIKKSKFLGQSQIPAGATLDYVSGGTNYKIDYSDFLQGLGVSGEIVQVGDPLQVPILDDQGAIKGIRNIRGANGVTVSIDPDNSVKISVDSAVIGGIDWVVDKTYGSEDIVRSGARYYISLVGNNLGNTPADVPAAWEDLFWGDSALVDARIFGVIADGRDCGPALSAANESGKSIFISAGSYTITTEPVFTKSLYFKGADGVSFTCATGVSGFKLVGEDLSHIQGSSIENITVIGSTASTTEARGISLRYVDDVRVENCIVRDFGGAVPSTIQSGIFLRDGERGLVTGCQVSNCGSDGIEFKGYINGTATENTVFSNKRHGIAFADGSHQFVVANNQVRENGETQGHDGIVITSDTVGGVVPKAGTITGNRCTNNADHGIHVYHLDDDITPAASGVEAIAITGNTCMDHQVGGGGSGIIIENVQNTTITGNTCYVNNYGISTWNARRSTIAGNTVIQQQERGISLEGAGGVNVTGNTITGVVGSPGHGIRVNTTAPAGGLNVVSSKCDISSNTITGCAGDNISIANSQLQIAIHGNRLDDDTISDSGLNSIAFNNYLGTNKVPESQRWHKMDGGLNTITAAGPIEDGDISATGGPYDGALVVDTANDRIAFRHGGEWFNTATVSVGAYGVGIWNRFQGGLQAPNTYTTGTPTDGDFEGVPTDGGMIVNSTDKKLWIRMNGVWREVSLV